MNGFFDEKITITIAATLDDEEDSSIIGFEF